jgi:hypothetical protein
MGLFFSKKKEDARMLIYKNGGILAMFDTFINIFKQDDFYLIEVKSTSFMLKHESPLANSSITLKFISDEEINILFLMTIKRKDVYFRPLEFNYPVNYNQYAMADELMEKVEVILTKLD